MVKNKFKVLMYCGTYVDINRLSKGLYSTDKPHLYSFDTTIEFLIEAGKMMKDIIGQNFICDNYFENLKKCTLKTFILIPEKDSTYNKYEDIKIEEEYNKALNSGMFWEFYPELTGNWLKDKEVILK